MHFCVNNLHFTTKNYYPRRKNHHSVVELITKSRYMQVMLCFKVSQVKKVGHCLRFFKFSSLGGTRVMCKKNPIYACILGECWTVCGAVLKWEKQIKDLMLKPSHSMADINLTQRLMSHRRPASMTGTKFTP